MTLYSRLDPFPLLKKVRILIIAVQNRKKIDLPSPFVRKMSALAQPPLSVRTHHKFRKI